MISRTPSLIATCAGAFVMLVGCATQSQLPTRERPDAQTRIGAMVNQPFADLNISGTEIPPLLQRAAAAPYAEPAKIDCDSLRARIDSLSAILGPDIASTKSDADGAILSEQSAGDAVWGAAQSAASGWIPFRGVIRFVTGADRHDRRVAAAIVAGFVRRAYLKGMRAHLSCPPRRKPVPLNVVAAPDHSKSSLPLAAPGH